MIKRRVLRMKCEGDKSLEATGFVLDLAELQEMIDAVLIVLDMAVEHCRIGFESQLVSQTGGVQPLAAVYLVVADDGAHARSEYLRASAGHGVYSGLAHLDQRIF